MKTIKKLVLMLALSTFVIYGYAQSTSAGKSFYVDYDEWCTLGYPSIYVNCGNDPAFNTGSQLTMEVWVRAYTFGENRKIMGKLSSQFNNGYVLGFENLNLYSEIFNPAKQEVPRSGPGPIPQDSAWVHLATTYNANGQMVNYINGVNVGEITVFPQAGITANSEPFIIGLAPWDLLSFEFVGNLDEVRIWNVARTEQQIKNSMFHQLSGNETGLVAYYDFNADQDSIVHDKAVNQLDGLLNNANSSCFSWAHSYAPVGDSIMSTKTDLNASWYGKNIDYTYAVTQNGLSLITSIGAKEFWKYVVFGHNNASGKTNADAPLTAPVDFERLSRVWYVNQGGSFNSQVVFNIQDAAAGGQALPTGSPDSLYTLLVRNDTTGDFTPLYSASTVMGNTVLFNNVNLQNKYYTLGHSSTSLAPPSTSINTIGRKQAAKIYPNPANEEIFIELAEKAEITMREMSGRVVYNTLSDKGVHQITVDNLKKGMYFITINSKLNTETHKIIIK